MGSADVNVTATRKGSRGSYSILITPQELRAFASALRRVSQALSPRLQVDCLPVLATSRCLPRGLALCRHFSRVHVAFCF